MSDNTDALKLVLWATGHKPTPKIEVDIRSRRLLEELMNVKPTSQNWAHEIHADQLYPVSYTISQSGERVYGDTKLLGADLTEKQILELYDKGYFNDKPKKEDQ